ncbi:antibiotic biosynthesis monooxygenase [Pseudoprimorskyibacter insulae]|uniref:ABM domain-containing protein n=1 Tax=Pseudoprimorskyibacter insulae TaxID=1695997 RepID=A0A2R8AYH6_9RHOB|nr:antibiotic biosynthesis monooxygenase [Pseudoprimorskyibacter insulae]SPF81082.1 hypothetical protein PRI8871_02899 [Pseudoprimorskyibacter insulae]
MVWTSIGGVKVKSLRHLPRFFLRAFQARKAALATEGCVSVDLFREGRLFFAVSVWSDPAVMKRYATTDVHARFMRQDADLFLSANNTIITGDTAPTRGEAVAHWKAKWG